MVLTTLCFLMVTSEAAKVESGPRPWEGAMAKTARRRACCLLLLVACCLLAKFKGRGV